LHGDGDKWIATACAIIGNPIARLWVGNTFEKRPVRLGLYIRSNHRLRRWDIFTSEIVDGYGINLFLAVVEDLRGVLVAKGKKVLFVTFIRWDPNF